MNSNDILPAIDQVIEHPLAPAEAAVMPITWGRVMEPGLLAIRRLWLPFVILQACGLAVVLAYFRLLAVRDVCDGIAVIKRQGGYAFSSAVMSFCGGFLPEICKYVTGVDRRLDQQRWRDLGFTMLLFAATGITCDAFYRILTATLGNSLNPLVIAAKVSIDQFVYTPTIGVGSIAIAFAWRRNGYNTPHLLRQINLRWYVLTAVPLLLPAWAYWIPMTSFMYALPGNLTFVYGAIATAAISLLFTTIVKAHRDEASHGPAT